MASTSSVYGANTAMPFTETQKTDTPMSFYAATKKANEAMAHSYAHLYGLPVTMFRFFTVYGPWGRPDMAPFKFTNAILEDRPIDIYNHGDMTRDFTYVTDLADSIVRLIEAVPMRPAAAADVPVGDSLSTVAPFRVVNIGNSKSVRLIDFNHREFGIVRFVDAFVAEHASDFIHAFDATDHQPFQVQLQSDPEIQLHIQRVVMRRERSRGCSTGDRVEYRRFDFTELVPAESLPNRINNRRTLQ